MQACFPLAGQTLGMHEFAFVKAAFKHVLSGANTLLMNPRDAGNTTP